jgi:uncharacterized integral membrane protein (TIGR00697 family)
MIYKPQNTNNSPKYLLGLGMMCATLLLISHVVQNRVILLGPTYATATIFIYPISCAVLDIISEIYGYKQAKKVLWWAIICTFLFAIPVQLFTELPIPSFWKLYDDKFDFVMSPIFRTTVVSSIAIICGQYVNIYIISKLRIMFKGRFFALRSISSSIIGDTITVAVALTGFFIGKMAENQIITIVVTELSIMYLYVFICLINVTTWHSSCKLAT